MENISSVLNKVFAEAINKAFGIDASSYLEVSVSTNQKFGHYQCNSAMRLAKELKKSPRDVATLIIDSIDVILFESLDIAGPGFINITLSKVMLAKCMKDMLIEPKFGFVTDGNSQERVVVDFSSPNIAKEMHVGHLRSTIIGDSIARLFEYLDYDVLRLNHIGDWGTAFGMLIAHMQDNATKVLSSEESASISDLMAWYKEAKLRFDSDEEFKDRSQKQVVDLQSGDSNALNAWKIICDLSRSAFKEIYILLDINAIERGESFYNPYLEKVVKDSLDSGLAEVSDGAVCIFLDGFTNRDGDRLPFMIRKSDGGYNYATTDLAAMWHRVTKEKANRIVIVTDNGQSEHFKMLFAVGEKTGIAENVELNHVPFGLVLGSDKKKFKTRSGTTEKLIDLLSNAVSKALETIKAREDSNLSDEEQDSLAEILGIGAVKYADLSNSRLSDYVFSYSKMLQFEGNTIVYLMYSYVRVAGIKRKLNLSDLDLEQLISSTELKVETETEIDLALHLSRFNDVLERFSKDLMPNKLTDYLYDLANKYNRFFRDCRVVGDELQDSRLVLCELVSKVMKQGMEILGIKPIDKM